jgi:hypothetical protein
MLKLLINILSFFHIYGWKGIYAIFRRVYWKQNLNGGYDIISLCDNDKCYFRGTLRQRKKWLGPLWEKK